MGRITTLAFVILLGLSTLVSAAPPPTVTNAADGIFNAFQTHSLVGLGDWHGMAQETDFYSTLIRDPRFATEVGNLVLEIGDAAQQGTIDRYVNGENVSYTELRKVWADTVGFDPTVPFIGSLNIFDTLRSVNMKLPPESRIKVWLGDPPIDWSKIKTKEDWLPLRAQRDSYPANLIAREILAKNKKALVIYGGAHFAPGENDLRGLLEKAHPGRLFIVSPYVGYTTAPCTAQFEKHIQNWQTPSLVSPIRGSSLEEDILPPGCGAYPRANDETDTQYETESRNFSGLTGDALLYLGPRNQMVWSPNSPDIYLDLDFRAELERRHELKYGMPISGWGGQQNPSVPAAYFPN